MEDVVGILQVLIHYLPCLVSPFVEEDSTEEAKTVTILRHTLDVQVLPFLPLLPHNGRTHTRETDTHTDGLTDTHTRTQINVVPTVSIITPISTIAIHV